jgi:FtsP/CotA-like multicopper oxidase with cupredoxin domain
MRRREFLSLVGAAAGQHALASILPRGLAARRSDIRLTIENCSLDTGHGSRSTQSRTTGKYQDQHYEGKPVSIEVMNATSSADVVHWHGLAIDSLNDGAMEEVLRRSSMAEHSFTTSHRAR